MWFPSADLSTSATFLVISMTTPQCLWCKHASHKHLTPTRKEHKAPAMEAGRHCDTQHRQHNPREAFIEASALRLQVVSSRAMFVVRHFLNLSASLPRKQWLQREETKIKCYLSASVQFNVWIEGDNSFRRCILFHNQFGPYILSNDSTTIVTGECFKIIHQRNSSAKIPLNGNCISQSCCQSNSLAEKGLIFTETDWLPQMHACWRVT